MEKKGLSALQQRIPSLSVVHEYNPTHFFCKCTVSDIVFIQSSISRWEHNRPPDAIRYKELAEKVFYNKTTLDTFILYVALDDSNQLKIVDGMHRFSALKEIQTLCSPELLSNFIMLSIRLYPSKGELVDWFQNLNNIIPVPELYIHDHSKQKREMIEEIVKEWTTRYSSHFTKGYTKAAQRAYRRPNMNVDTFRDVLSELYDKQTPETTTEFSSRLMQLNETLKIKEHWKNKTISVSMLEKCNKTGCFLFLYKPDTLIDLA
jgi:hypothetical protein